MLTYIARIVKLTSNALDIAVGPYINYMTCTSMPSRLISPRALSNVVIQIDNYMH